MKCPIEVEVTGGVNSRAANTLADGFVTTSQRLSPQGNIAWWHGAGVQHACLVL